MSPARCGIYFLFKDGGLVYVGKSINCPWRIREHRENGRPFDYSLMASCPEEDLTRVELALIMALRPPQNRAGVPQGDSSGDHAARVRFSDDVVIPAPTAPKSDAPLARVGHATAEILAMSVQDAARTMGISRATVYRLVGAGALPTAKVRGRTLVRRADIAALLSDGVSAA